ncbi:TPA: HlyD family efflux transporter periplasmic adaptor subunit [Shewanella algae]|uniref:HlyD family secretion protein n=1 Tax=Shewanella algae TaxID=38313 RepID=UPI001C55B29F|nr:HlyD family efflux transporter periplasmic adaptor subunit [Shewanella algae]HDS1212374.1 HlyD family efflux transporter periplasmic adaptor subunit [Shewanella algae]
MFQLFRENVSNSQNTHKLYGVISLAQPISVYLIVSSLIFIVSICILFLFFSEYSRKETVQGFLVPSSGVIKVYSSSSGTIESIYVKEGAKVKKGDLVAKVVLSRPQLNGVDLSETLLSGLKSQLSLLEQDEKNTVLVAKLDLQRLKQKVLDLTETEKVLERQQLLLDKKHKLQQQEFERFSKIYSNGYLSETEHQSQQQKLLQIAQEMESNKSNIVNISAQLNEAKAEVASHPHQTELRLADITRRKTDVQRQVDETQNDYEFSIIAKEAGLVTSIAVKEGEFLPTNRPLLSIIPEGAELVAELLLPTRSAGFVKLRDEARLRFDAFPYQRFGFMAATVSRIDKSLLLQGEADIPVQLDEPVYRVQTTLSQQIINAYGEEFALKPGMLLEADIILDKRSLLDWLLDPIYSLKGRVG